MIAATLPQTAPDETYALSVTSVTSFVQWIEGQSVLPNPSDQVYSRAANAFAQMKADSMQWINQVYPACIEMPQAIVSAGEQITPTLGTLTTVAQQLASQPDNQDLHTAIVQNAASLSATVAGLQSQIGGLAGSLGAFAQTLSGDVQSATASDSDLMQDIAGTQSTLGSLYGRLNALKNKACPSQSDIDACEAQIQTTQNALTSLWQLNGQMQQAISGASSACQGLSYMAGFWSTVAGDAAQVVVALNRMSSDPVAILGYDLTTAAQAWAQTEGLARQTVGQLSSSQR